MKNLIKNCLLQRYIIIVSFLLSTSVAQLFAQNSNNAETHFFTTFGKNERASSLNVKLTLRPTAEEKQARVLLNFKNNTLANASFTVRADEIRDYRLMREQATASYLNGMSFSASTWNRSLKTIFTEPITMGEINTANAGMKTAKIVLVEKLRTLPRYLNTNALLLYIENLIKKIIINL